MPRRLVYSAKALADLDTVYDYIALDNPARARKHVAEIQARCRALLDNPELGPARPLIRPGLRIYPAGRRVVVAYRIVPEGIRIVRVFSGGQDYEAILAAEE